MNIKLILLGIGLMMARALALNGAHKVYIVGRRREVLEKAAASVETENIIPLVGDVTSKESLASVVSTITSEVGYINVLVANSGMLGPQASSKLTASSTIADFQKAWGDASIDEWDKTFQLNVSAVWFTIVAFLGLLDEGNKKGNVVQKSQVIATSSIGGFNRTVPGGYAYGQSKAATTHLIKQLATNLVPFGIRSNAIAPGCKCFTLGSIAIVSESNLPSSIWATLSLKIIHFLITCLTNTAILIFNSVPLRSGCGYHRCRCLSKRQDST